jgi:CYTH domain-containing protein
LEIEVIAKQRPPLQPGALIEQGYLVFQDPPEIPVEFSSESQAGEFTPPPWFGREVTRDPRYTNAELAG